jgi:hypothetical protein
MTITLCLVAAGALLAAFAIRRSPRRRPRADGRPSSGRSRHERDDAFEALVLFDITADGDLDGDFERAPTVRVRDEP